MHHIQKDRLKSRDVTFKRIEHSNNNPHIQKDKLISIRQQVWPKFGLHIQKMPMFRVTIMNKLHVSLTHTVSG